MGGPHGQKSVWATAHTVPAPMLSGLNLVVAAVLRDNVCVVSLLPCVTDCCMLYTVCEVERFVLTITKRRLLLL